MNLSNNQSRRVEQQEKIGRRTSIIDDRRNTRAPVLEANANLRNSRRGDVAGAQALMRTLGMVEQGVSDFQKYATNKHIDEEQTNIAQGMADEAAGTVNDEMMEKSLGYRNAVTKGRTVTAFSKATREFSEELEGLIENQDSPSLEERQAEVSAMLEGFYTDFAKDPETGELREFLQSPGAMRYLAEAIQTSRPGAMQNAMARIEERFNREALSHYSENITDQVLDTGTVDLTQSLSLLPESVTDEQRAETTLVAVNNAVEALRAEGRYEEATRLLAGLRGRFDTPADAGEPTALPTGTGNTDLLRMPVAGTVSSEFGAARASGSHNGVDIAVPVGTPVVAPMGGEVVRAWDADRGGVSLKVKYDDGTVAGFAHLSEQLVKEGRFEAGAELALTGNTGKSTGPHLHYTLTRDGKKINPLEADFGAVSVDPNTAAAPAARLTDPNADPITRIEQSGTVEPIMGIEGVTFTPQQQARIDAIYQQTTDQMRREWTKANDERQSQNSSNLALGIFGVGGNVTTMRDIRGAWEKGEISDEAVMSLVGLHERRTESREARVERRESRAEREERKQAQRQTEAASENIIGQMIRGELSPAQAREAGIMFAGRGNFDPEVSMSVLSTVHSAANEYESAIQNSEPVREAMTEYRDLVEDIGSYVDTLGVPPYRKTVAEDGMTDIFDRAQARLLRRVMDGEDPAKAKEAVETWVARQQDALIKKLTPTNPQY